MGGKPLDDAERAAIAAHAQRTAEQAALRNVRKALDRMQASEARERRTLRRVLLACAALTVLGALYLGALFFGGQSKAPALQVPATAPQRP